MKVFHILIVDSKKGARTLFGSSSRQASARTITCPEHSEHCVISCLRCAISFFRCDSFVNCFIPLTSCSAIVVGTCKVCKLSSVLHHFWDAAMQSLRLWFRKMPWFQASQRDGLKGCRQ